MKIEFKHLAPYLPHKLQVQYEGIINSKERSEYHKKWHKEHSNPNESDYNSYNLPEEVMGLKIGYIKIVGINLKYIRYSIGNKHHGLKTHYGTNNFKPILKPLSDYTDIFELPMVELNCDIDDQIAIEQFADQRISLASLPYSAYEVLVRNKVDIFDLIPQNLAIDLNTLKP